MNEICEERCYAKLTDAGPRRVWRLAPIEGGPCKFFGRGVLGLQVDPRYPPMQIPFEFDIAGDTPEQAFAAYDVAGEAGAHIAEVDARAEIAKARRRVVIAGEVPRAPLRAAPTQS